MFNFKTRAGESLDFPAFYRTYERLIRSTLFHLVGKDDLDDLVQQVFVRCWQSHSRFEGRSKESTWITKIAINMAKDHWRNRGGKVQAERPAEESDIADEQSAAASLRLENREALERAMQQLSFEHRSVIALMYFQDMSIEEIGEHTGESTGTIKSRLHYAKKELRRLLSKMGVEV